jgi:hypothetical protein
MKTVKTNPSTLKTASSPEKMAQFGNAGNTKGTRLPNGGCPKGTKKSGKRRKGY